MRSAAGGARPVLVLGGAGFIGTNVAHRLLSSGQPVRVFDNLSRPGVERNLRWLMERYPRSLQLRVADVREAHAVREAAADAVAVVHLAAQVAVTTSLEEPLRDFEVNARGTLNVLEALRALEEPPPLVFTSTNKVYGALEDVEVRVRGQRYEPADARLRAHGVGESRPLDFHSPYGCSKGAADQYVLDYARSYGLPAVALRMSCIYGPHQHGNEDQGWVAHFLIRALEGRPLTLYGNGLQVRDILYVEDLVDAVILALGHAPRLGGRAFNLGGGPARTTSLLELLGLIEQITGVRPVWRQEGWRRGDQRYFVADTRAFQQETGWTPRVEVEEGVRRLAAWLVASRARARGMGGAVEARP